MSVYNINEAPDLASWIPLDTEQRRAEILEVHPEGSDFLHPEGYPRAFHVGLHVMIEDRLAAGDEATARTLARLQADGLRRHAALHAVMDVALPFLARPQDYDAAAHARALDALDAAEWLSRRVSVPR